MPIGIYSKAVSAAVVAGLAAAITALADNTIGVPDGVAIALAVLGALGAVWAVPNLPAGVARYGKAATAGLIAGLGSVATALTSTSGISAAEWLGVAIAVIGGLGLTAVVPNAVRSDEFARDARGRFARSE